MQPLQEWYTFLGYKDIDLRKDGGDSEIESTIRRYVAATKQRVVAYPSPNLNEEQVRNHLRLKEKLNPTLLFRINDEPHPCDFSANDFLLRLTARALTPPFTDNLYDLDPLNFRFYYLVSEHGEVIFDHSELTQNMRYTLKFIADINQTDVFQHHFSMED
jgi:hypothetical protein